MLFWLYLALKVVKWEVGNISKQGTFWFMLYIQYFYECEVKETAYVLDIIT
jgi:hypothetical protein